MWAMHNWLKESFRENKPFDQFVRELITAKGSTFTNGPANYFRIASNPQRAGRDDASSSSACGCSVPSATITRSRSISQDDYYGLAAFFARVGTKSEPGVRPVRRRDGRLGPSRRRGRRTRGPASVMPPTPLDGEPVDDDRSTAAWRWPTG